MFHLLRRLFGHVDAAPAAAIAPPATPDWAVELGDQSGKAARAQARLGLRLDEVVVRLDAGFDDLRRQVRESAAARPAGGDVDLSPVCDAMDLLEDLSTSAARRGDVEQSLGLERILERLQTQLRLAGLSRLRLLGTVPDGKLARVIAAEPRADLPPGRVCRVVRAPVLAGAVLLREGAVAVSVAPPTEPSHAEVSDISADQEAR